MKWGRGFCRISPSRTCRGSPKKSPTCGAVPPELSLEVIEEFHEMLETQQYMIHGGLDYATKLLVDTFGKQRAEDLLALVKRAQEASQSDLTVLQTRRSPATRQVSGERASADDRRRAGPSGREARLDGDRQPQRGAAGRGDSAAGRHAAVFSGDGPACGDDPAPAAGKYGGHGPQGLFGVQSRCRPAEPHGIGRDQEDSG